MLSVLKDRKMVSLYVFFIVYFFSIGITTYSGRFYGEIGLTDSQIGLISALPASVSTVQVNRNCRPSADQAMSFTSTTPGVSRI